MAYVNYIQSTFLTADQNETLHNAQVVGSVGVLNCQTAGTVTSLAGTTLDDVLTWDGSKWISQAPSGGGAPAAGSYLVTTSTNAPTPNAVNIGALTASAVSNQVLQFAFSGASPNVATPTISGILSSLAGGTYTLGCINYGSGSASMTQLPMNSGDAGKVLTVNTGGTAPQWSLPAIKGVGTKNVPTNAASQTVNITDSRITASSIVVPLPFGVPAAPVVGANVGLPMAINVLGSSAPQAELKVYGAVGTAFDILYVIFN